MQHSAISMVSRIFRGCSNTSTNIKFL